jgi:pimeloyl-ACP methyl ester carboxylesterase
MVVGGIGAGVVERGGVDTRALDPTVLQDAMRADDPTTITDPGARQFRAFADSTGADRLALAAHVASVHPLPIALEQITAPTLVLAGRDDQLAVRPRVLASAIPRSELLVIDGDHLGAVGVPAFAPAVVNFVNGS